MTLVTVIGSKTSYACVRAPDGAIPIRLMPDCSVEESLRRWADEQQARAERIHRNVEAVRQAAAVFLATDDAVDVPDQPCRRNALGLHSLEDGL